MTYWQDDTALRAGTGYRPGYWRLRTIARHLAADHIQPAIWRHEARELLAEVVAPRAELGRVGPDDDPRWPPPFPPGIARAALIEMAEH